jgi:hypothetical protein
MAGSAKRIEAIGYLRTSSATNVGEGKDSEARQLKAIESFAKSPATASLIGSTTWL